MHRLHLAAIRSIAGSRMPYLILFWSNTISRRFFRPSKPLTEVMSLLLSSRLVSPVNRPRLRAATEVIWLPDSVSISRLGSGSGQAAGSSTLRVGVERLMYLFDYLSYKMGDVLQHLSTQNNAHQGMDAQSSVLGRSCEPKHLNK